MPVNGDGSGIGKRQEARGKSVDNNYSNYMISSN